jgi:hypothetical protein
MKIVTCIAVAVLAVALLSGGAMAAGEFSMWFGNAAGDPIGSLDIAPGATFDVNVFMSTTINSFSFDAAVGWDVSTTDGAAAVPTLNKIGLATGVANTDLVWGDITGLFTTSIGKSVAGFRGSGSRPYGADLVRANMDQDVVPFAKAQIATLHLKNNMVGGDSQNITLYDGGAGDSLTTMLMDSNFAIYRGVTGTLKINSTVVPEPGSLLALACGVMGLAGFAIRRRK